MNNLQASRVIGIYLWQNRDQALFIHWLKQDIGITNPAHILKLYQCVDDWCCRHVWAIGSIYNISQSTQAQLFIDTLCVYLFPPITLKYYYRNALINHLI